MPKPAQQPLPELAASAQGKDNRLLLPASFAELRLPGKDEFLRFLRSPVQLIPAFQAEFCQGNPLVSCDTEHELKWRKAILIAHRAKCSYDTGICDFFPYNSQMQQRRKAMFL